MKNFKDFKLPKLPLLTSMLSKVLLIYYPFFHHLLRLITLPFPRKVIGTSFSKYSNQNWSLKRKAKWSKFAPLKKRRRKEVKENPNLVALGRFQAWWPMEGSNDWWPLGKHLVWCLMFGGLWKEKEKHHFHLFSLPPLSTNFT